MGHVASMGGEMNAKSISVGKSRGKRGWTEYSYVRIRANDGCLWAH